MEGIQGIYTLKGTPAKEIYEYSATGKVSWREILDMKNSTWERTNFKRLTLAANASWESRIHEWHGHISNRKDMCGGACKYLVWNIWG